MLQFLRNKILLLTILSTAHLSQLNATKFEFDSDQNTDKKMRVKIRIYSPDEYKKPFVKLNIAHGEIGEVNLTELLEEIKAKASQFSSKKLMITCEPAKTDYSYLVLNLLEIEDYTTFDFSKLDQQNFKINLSTDHPMHLLTLTAQK